MKLLQGTETKNQDIEQDVTNYQLVFRQKKKSGQSHNNPRGQCSKKIKKRQKKDR